MPKKPERLPNGTYYRDGMDSAKHARALITTRFRDIATTTRDLEDGLYSELAKSLDSARDEAEGLLPTLGGYDEPVTSEITDVLDNGLNVLVAAQVALPNDTKASLGLSALEVDLRSAISNARNSYPG